MADRGTIRALQFEKLTALLAKTWESNPFYRDHWQAAGVTARGHHFARGLYGQAAPYP